MEARADAVRAAIDRIDVAGLQALFLDPTPEGLARRCRYRDYQPNPALKYPHLRNIIMKAIAQLARNTIDRRPTAWALFQIAQAMVDDGAPIDENNRTDRTPLCLLAHAMNRGSHEWIAWFLERALTRTSLPKEGGRLRTSGMKTSAKGFANWSTTTAGSHYQMHLLPDQHLPISSWRRSGETDSGNSVAGCAPVSRCLPRQGQPTIM